MFRKSFCGVGSILIVACAPVSPTTGRSAANLPDAVVSVAAPNQDLTTAVLREDGCYWYSYSGPVETTMLPLRTRAGGPICIATEAESDDQV